MSPSFRRSTAAAIVPGLAALALAAAGVGRTQAAAARTPAGVVRGQRTFLENCAMCHGEGGMGDGELAPELLQKAGVKVANLTDRGELDRLGRKGVEKVISGGGAHSGKSNLMPAWGGRLSAQEVRDVADYVLHLPDATPGIPAAVLKGFVSAPAGTPEAGRSVFLHECTVCHGLDARGDGRLAAALVSQHHVRPRNLTDSAYIATRTDRDLYLTISQGGGEMGKSPYMPHWGGFLTPEQIKDLVSFVRAISHTPAQP
ncbi:MAG TPA: c-type cytochrome [Candidatus Eisenbacteria bacterium]|nr:c-type cytochrome [Candidatus Eisenbacteria bacterium]